MKSSDVSSEHVFIFLNFVFAIIPDARPQSQETLFQVSDAVYFTLFSLLLPFLFSFDSLALASLLFLFHTAVHASRFLWILFSLHCSVSFVLSVGSGC